MKRLPLLGAAALGLLSVCAPAFADGYRSPRHDHDRGSWHHRDRHDDRHHDRDGHGRYDRGRYEGRHEGRNEGRYDRGRSDRDGRHSWRVLYRSSCGTTSWREFGCYDCRESAEHAARHLDRGRYQIRVECA